MSVSSSVEKLFKGGRPGEPKANEVVAIRRPGGGMESHFAGDRDRAIPRGLDEVGPIARDHPVLFPALLLTWGPLLPLRLIEQGVSCFRRSGKNLSGAVKRLRAQDVRDCFWVCFFAFEYEYVFCGFRESFVSYRRNLQPNGVPSFLQGNGLVNSLGGEWRQAKEQEARSNGGSLKSTRCEEIHGQVRFREGSAG